MNEKTTKVLKISLVVLVAGILDNLIATFFQNVLEAPLFMDIMISMAVLFAYGIIPSILTYVVFTTIACIRHIIMFGQHNYLYIFTISAVAIIFVTWIFVRKKENLKKGVNFTFIYILSACVCAGLASSVISGFLSYFTYTLPPTYAAIDKIIYAFAGEPLGILGASIVGRIPMTILDRIITTFAGFGISKLYFYILQKNKRTGGGIPLIAILLNEKVSNTDSVPLYIGYNFSHHNCFVRKNLGRKIQRVQNSL